jgi:predicted glycoside hydrolase/deacetylase ChbG (UPF0249 family)
MRRWGVIESTAAKPEVEATAQDNRADRHKTLVVCVDDFGYDEEVDESILALAAQGRISATSVLVDAPCCEVDAPRLATLGARLDIGLHLNLSETFADGPQHRAWRPLVLAALARRLDPVALRHEITRQLDAFERHVGRAPDFVDGHRHVHQLPVVRDALVEVLQSRRGAGRPVPWLRRTTPRQDPGAPLGERFKAGVIGALGGGGLHRRAVAAGFPQNRRMLGVYGFDAAPLAHEHRLARWLAAAHDQDLLMCHTALPARGDKPADPIAAARVVEHQALASDTFLRQLAGAGVRVGRLRR